MNVNEDEAAEPLEVAAQVYARLGRFPAATRLAEQAVEVRRGLCLESATEDRLGKHAYALDLLASIFRARGMTDAVTGCLVQLVELHFECGNSAGVAWAVRELGAQALLSGDPDNAVVQFTRAVELYAECGEDDRDDDCDDELAEERGECRVLLGRARLAQGDREAALLCFKRAVDDFADAGAHELVREVTALQDAVSSAAEPPAPALLKVGDFGLAEW
ncbi:tetratricopeptide repeat protein [Saccharothrix stipae]